MENPIGFIRTYWAMPINVTHRHFFKNFYKEFTQYAGGIGAFVNYNCSNTSKYDICKTGKVQILSIYRKFMFLYLGHENLLNSEKKI